MPKIKLSRGYEAIVDIDDYEELKQWRWSITSNGYAKRCTKKNKTPVSHYMHRQIMGYPKGHVDHINGDRLDNRRQNLRAITPSGNGLNRVELNKNNSTGHRGITWDKSRSKWAVMFMKNYKHIHLGRYDKLEDAIKVKESWLKNNA